MVSAKDINYECDMQENITIEDIREEYKNGVIVWLNGSGVSSDGNIGSYRCVLDYMGHIKFIEKELIGATANQAMITGAIDAMQCITKSVRIYLISTTALGFSGGFKGKGANGDLIQQLCEEIKAKNCSLTEVQCLNCGEIVKKFIYSCNPDETKRNTYEKIQEDKQKHKYQYKEMLYNECISKVIEVLINNDIDNNVINEIRKIRPE